MRRGTFKSVLAGAFVALSAGAALAQGAWDGNWVGTTPRGGSVQVTIARGSPTAYVFRGQSVPITGASVSGSTMTINVNGGIPATVQLVRKGNAVAYSYSDAAGGTATATLSKQ